MPVMAFLGAGFLVVFFVVAAAVVVVNVVVAVYIFIGPGTQQVPCRRSL